MLANAILNITGSLKDRAYIPGRVAYADSWLQDCISRRPAILKLLIFMETLNAKRNSHDIKIPRGKHGH